MSGGRLNVYRIDRAAKVLGISKRQLQRLTAELGLQRGRMGSNLTYLYSDANLEQIRELRNKHAGQR